MSVQGEHAGFFPMKLGTAVAFTAISGSTAVALPAGARRLTFLADQGFYFKVGGSGVQVAATAGNFDGRWLPSVPLNLAVAAGETHVAVLRVSADGTILVSSRG